MIKLEEESSFSSTSSMQLCAFWHSSFIWIQIHVLWCYSVCGLKGTKVVVRWSNGRKKAANFSVLPQLLFWHGIFITIFIWLQFNVLWCYAVCGLKGRKGWQVIKSEEAGFFHVFPQCSDTRASYIFIYENVHIWVQIRCTMICCVWVERKKRMWADNGRNEAVSFSAIPQFLFL